MNDLKEFARRACQTAEQRRDRELRRIDHLERRGVATWDDLARAQRLKRESAEEEFNRREAGR